MEKPDVLVNPNTYFQHKRFIKRTQEYIENLREVLENFEDGGISYLNKLGGSDQEGECKKSGKTRKIKDPDAPKMPASAYILYSIVRRNELKEKNSGKEARVDFHRIIRKRKAHTNWKRMEGIASGRKGKMEQSSSARKGKIQGQNGKIQEKEESTTKKGKKRGSK